MNCHSLLTFPQEILWRNFNTIHGFFVITVWQILHPRPWEGDRLLVHYPIYVDLIFLRTLHQLTLFRFSWSDLFKSTDNIVSDFFFQIVSTVEFTRSNSRHTSDLYSPLHSSLITWIFTFFFLFETVTMLSFTHLLLADAKFSHSFPASLEKGTVRILYHRD
jgi:hypothetical protein